MFEAGGGWCALAWGDPGVRGLSLPAPSRDDALRVLEGFRVRLADAPSRLAQDVTENVISFLEGRLVDLARIPLDLPGFSPFRLEVSRAVRAIPRGEVRTYGQVAASVGSPGAARAVGRAMALNPVPLLVPCHRVVGADGALTGFSARGGIAAKRRLLDMERGVADCRRFVTVE